MYDAQSKGGADELWLMGVWGGYFAKGAAVVDEHREPQPHWGLVSLPILQALVVMVDAWT